MLSEAKHLHLWEQPASTTCSPDATIADTPKTIDAACIVGVRTKETTLNEPSLTRFDTQRIAQHPANVMPAKLGPHIGYWGAGIQRRRHEGAH